jgi:hypothetical protein
MALLRKIVGGRDQRILRVGAVRHPAVEALLASGCALR